MPVQTDTELKPCPFCGGPATTDIEDNGGGTFWIICDNVKDGCGCEGPYQHSPDNARAAWNRRPAQPESGLLAEAAKVKPLEWDKPDSWTWNIAKSVVGTYVVRPCLATNYAGQWVLRRAGEETSDAPYPSEEAAKAAAQSDYEQRIRSALEERVAPVAEIVSAATPAAEILFGRDIKFLADMRNIPIGTKLYAALAAPVEAQTQERVMGRLFYDETGKPTLIGFEHSAQKEIERLNDELTCASEAYHTLIAYARSFADLFVCDNGSDRTLSVDDIDMTELTHRYADLEAALATASEVEG